MSLTRAAPLAMLAALLAAAPAASASEATFRAQGNEPFRSLRMGGTASTCQPMDGALGTIAPVPQPAVEGGARVYRATVENEDFVLSVADNVCTDTMSGMPFPATVDVELGADGFSGCGGEPVALLLGEWTVAAIDGKPPVADTVPTLSFGEDGKLGGAASCNRFFGSYTLSGEGLGIGALGASMMACEEPVMAQERAVLDILEGTTGFAIAADGALVLSAGDGRTITAHRGG